MIASLTVEMFKDVIEEIHKRGRIGNSQFFKTTVKRLGHNFIGYEIFPDHFNYSKTDLINIENNAKKAGATYILTTQKDWVKLRELSPRYSFGIIDIRIRASNENLFLK